MSATASPVRPATSQLLRSSARRRRWPLATAWGTLAILLLINLPAFLCMGLDSDISMYDLIARRVLLGDVPYRDLLETNFPGIVWLHMAFRSLLGWRSEALRAVDFAIVALCTWLLVSWLPRPCPAWNKVALALALSAFYLSTSEWCHCQRDTWMLLPALIALKLRARQAEQLASRRVRGFALAGWAAVEGTAWAAAFWIKPFVAVPAAACCLLTALGARGVAFQPAEPRQRIPRANAETPSPAHPLVVDLVFLLAAGLMVGAAGIGWLVARGAWPAFVEVMFVWNREYFAFNVLGHDPWGPLLGFVARLFPWILVHVAAVPVAFVAIWRSRSGIADGRRTALLAAFYLGWLLQAVLLQHLFDYVHVPAILLGLAVIAVVPMRNAECGMRNCVRHDSCSTLLAVFSAAFVVFCLAWCYPALCAQRIPAWVSCVTEGSTATVRDHVTLLRRVDWTNLERVAHFVREQAVRDGELTSFSLPTVALYGELNLRPSTRYILLQDHLDIFMKRQATIRAAVANSGQQLLVCDLGRYNMQRVRAAIEGQGARPISVSSDGFSAAGQVIFRAGNYVVFRLSGQEMPAWLEGNELTRDRTGERGASAP